MFRVLLRKAPQKRATAETVRRISFSNCLMPPIHEEVSEDGYELLFELISTASGALVVGGVRDICSSSSSSKHPPEIGLSVQWSTTNQSVAVCGSL